MPETALVVYRPRLASAQASGDAERSLRAWPRRIPTAALDADTRVVSAIPCARPCPSLRRQHVGERRVERFGRASAARAGRRRRRWRERHEHRVPPDEARRQRRRPPRAQGAHERHDVARRRAHHLGRHADRDVPVDVALHDRAAPEAHRGDRAGHGVPHDRAPPPRVHAAAPRDRDARGPVREGARRPRRDGRRGGGRPAVAEREDRRHPRRGVGAGRRSREPRRRRAGVRARRADGGRSDRRGRLGHRVHEGPRPRHRRSDRPRPHRDRDRRDRGGDVGTAARGARGRFPPAAGRRALLPAHRRRRLGAPGPSRRRGPRPLRLLPGGGRRRPRRAVRAQGGAVVARRDPARSRLRGARAGLGPSRRVPVRRDGPVPVAARGRHPSVLLRPRVLHRRQRPAARRGARAPRVLRGVRAVSAR
jgi:hypothetical protein